MSKNAKVIVRARVSQDAAPSSGYADGAQLGEIFD